MYGFGSNAAILQVQGAFLRCRGLPTRLTGALAPLRGEGGWAKMCRPGRLASGSDCAPLGRLQ